MARGRCTFRQQDVTRALRAAEAAGVQVQRYEIDKDGKITIFTAALEQGASDAPGGSKEIVL
jgi:hypothetical protein